MSISQVVNKFTYSIDLAKAYQGGIVLSKYADEIKRRILSNGVDVKESYFGTVQEFFLEEVINEFAHAVDDEVCSKSFTLVEDDGTTSIIDYLKNGEIPAKRFNEVVLLCLPQADKFLRAKYKFILSDNKIDDRIIKVMKSYGLTVV